MSVPKMALEVLEELEDQRLQTNVSRVVNQVANTGITAGCISGEKYLKAENVWRVSHSLGRKANGFVLIAQGSTSSLICAMDIEKSSTTEAEISFSSDPTSFTLFFY